MDFDLTSEQQMLKDGAVRYVREKYDFDSRRALAAGEPGWSPAHWAAFADLGWLALSLPEDVGGLAFPFLDSCILTEAFGKGLVLEPYTSTVILCAYILEVSGNAEIREVVLSAVAGGEAKLALAHDEPGVRHQRHKAAAQARSTVAGYLLDGAKTMVFDGPSADYFILSATLEDDDFALFLVDAKTPNLHIKSYRLIDGTRAADLDFSALALEKSALLLSGAAALQALETALDRAVLAQSAEALGAMQTVLQVTSAYIKTRVQFGQPIGKFQALQHKMAEMFTEAQSARSILYHGLASIDASPPQRAAAVSAAKVATAAAGFAVGGQGIQLHGGMGMTDEYAVGHYFKRLVALEKAYGDSSWHLARYTKLSAVPD
jgi:alkylation response protein AidB-like acyl-CoA dehydrogenase